MNRFFDLLRENYKAGNGPLAGIMGLMRGRDEGPENAYALKREAAAAPTNAMSPLAQAKYAMGGAQPSTPMPASAGMPQQMPPQAMGGQMSQSPFTSGAFSTNPGMARMSQSAGPIGPRKGPQAGGDVPGSENGDIYQRALGGNLGDAAQMAARRLAQQGGAQNADLEAVEEFNRIISGRG